MAAIFSVSCSSARPRLVERAGSALAALVANDSRARRHCRRASERHRAVPAAAEAAFRRGLGEIETLVADGRSRAHAAVEQAAAEVTQPAAEG